MGVATAAIAAAAAFAAPAASAAPGCPPDPSFTRCVIHAHIGIAVIAGQFTPNSPVHFQVYESKQSFDAGAPPILDVTNQSGSDGTAHLHSGQMLQLSGGNFLAVTDEATGTVKTLDVSPIVVLDIDRQNDTISGTGRPGEPIHVLIGPVVPGGAPSATAVPDANGMWSLGPSDFTPPNPDITEQSDIAVTTTDADGDITRAPPPPGCPAAAVTPNFCQIGSHVDNDLVAVHGMKPNSQVMLQVFDQQGVSRYGPVTLPTNARGDTSATNLAFEHGIDLLPGFRIEATDIATGTVKSLIVGDVSILEVNPTTNTVSGTAGTGPVRVSPTGGPGTIEAPVEGGQWSVDWFASIGYDFGEQDAFTAQLNDADNDVTFAELGAPLPGCVPSQQTVCGSAADETFREGDEIRPAQPEGGTIDEGAPASAAGAGAPLSVFAGPGDDIALVGVGRITPQTRVDLGTGALEGVVIGPGSTRPKRPPEKGPVAPNVIVTGHDGAMLVVLPTHAGNLVLKVVGGSAGDRVSTREYGGSGSSRGGYRIAGNDGDDAITTGDGEDRLKGGNGNDSLIAGRGNDFLSGGEGADTLRAGRGRDICVKGAGDVTRGCEVVRRG